MSDQPSTTPKVVLVGNPNVGKSVLFNALTGAYTTVSNYPGTSVEVSSGFCTIDTIRYEILDTPGMYSMMPITEEERVARRILLTDAPHVVVHVIDARNIVRMLPMTLQLIEAGLPVVLVVNILDEAERLGMKIDLQLLHEHLGIPVVGAVMRRRIGLDELRQAISQYASVPHKPFSYSVDLEEDILQLSRLIRGEYRLSKRATSLLLLQRDEDVEQLVEQQESEQDWTRLSEKIREITFRRRADLHLQISLERRKVCTTVLDDVVEQKQDSGESFSEKLSRWMVHPLYGAPILVLVIYLGLYKFVGGFGAGTLVDFFEGHIFENYLNPPVVDFARNSLHADWLFELVAGEYGLWTLGIRYAVALVLPIVGSFFLIFSLLEDSGYFPRLALLVDRLFKRIGLSGRAVIPIVLGFGCDTMATLVTRTLETRRERIIATMLLALAVPCSAQLGVILGLLSVSARALLVWLLFLLLIFLVIGYLAGRLLPGDGPVFYMEIPPLRMPQLRNVLIKTLTRMKGYFVEILPLFLVASVILWAGKMTGGLAALVDGLAPLVEMVGLPREATTAFVFGFFRRDFGAAGLYDLQSSGMLNITQLTVAAVTLTLFVPCVAQFLVMMKERGAKTALGIFVMVTVLAFGSGWLLNKLLVLSGFLA